MLAADFTKALIIDNNNGKGDMNKTEVEWPLQTLEAKNSPVIKNFNISDNLGRYARIQNIFQLFIDSLRPEKTTKIT